MDKPEPTGDQLRESTREIWVAEYTRHGERFHVNRMDKSIRDNRALITQGVPGEWIPFFAGTESECRDACDELSVALGKEPR